MEEKLGGIKVGEGLEITSGGVLSASGGGGGASVLIVTDTAGSLDKTWQEIHDAAPLVYVSDGEGYLPLGSVYEDEGDYCANFSEPQPTGNNIYTYVAESASGYPVRST